MISYDSLWKTMKEKGATTYTLRYKDKIGVAAIQRLKNGESVSTNTLHKEFKELTTRLPTLWTNSYFVSTIGGEPLAVIKQYIESQKTSERRKKL